MRRQAREMALQVLFQVEYAPQISFEDLIALYDENKKDESILSYSKNLVNGVTNNKEKIDQKIQEASRHWKIERMGGVDRNIIRIAVYEMHYANELVEPKVVINEAIEVAKIYGSQESSAFVNGILDQIVRNDRA